MTLTQILQKIKSAFYTKAETESKLNAKANSSDLNNYLPKSGGTMAGNLEYYSTSDGFKPGFDWIHNNERFAYVHPVTYETSGEKVLVIQADTDIRLYSNNLEFNGKQVATSDDLSNYLPLNGGTMNATIKTHTSLGGPAIQHISPSDGTLGGELWLFNAKTDYHGGAILRCRSEDGVSFKDFVVKADGVCAWDNRAVDTIEEQGVGYIRYSNGIQICYGTIVTQTQLMPVTFAKPFLGLTSYGITALGSTATRVWLTGERTSTNVTLSTDSLDGAHRRVDWVAIGVWE